MKRLIYILPLLLFFACDKNEIGPQFTGTIEEIAPTSRSVYIVNEGNFGWGNGSLSLYDPTTNEIQQQVFNAANGLALGDVPQSMSEHNGRNYIMVNSSGKIEVTDTASLESIATIPGLNSPRYFLGIGNKAYVTDLYADAISIVDLNTNSISGQIAYSDWTERIISHNGKVYCGAYNTGTVLEIDPSTDQVVDTIALTKGVGNMVIDTNGKLWVLCSGGINDQTPTLYQIEPSNNSILQSFAFGSINESPGNLCVSANGNSLYFINSDVFRMNIADAALPTSAWIAANGRILYSMDVDPVTSDLYVVDAIDYVQASDVYRYDDAGALVDQFKGGVISTGFFFGD